MVALASLPYTIATFITTQFQIRPRSPTVRCSVRIPARRIRRKNYLRPKILKTLTKPYPDPIVEVHLEPELEKSSAVVVEEEELETPVGVNVGGLEEVQVARDAVVGFKGVSGRMVFRIAVSFVGLFVLQTVVSVWLLGSGDTDEKDRDSGSVGLYEKEVGLNGVVRDSGSPVVVDVNKVDEIRRMARAVREAERRKKISENGGDGLEDLSDAAAGEDLEADNSIRSGIAEEIDGRLTRLRKRSSLPSVNVAFLNKAGDSAKVTKDGGVVGKEENGSLIFQAKRKFRSQLRKSEDKPKGFQSIAGVKERNGNTNDEQHGMNAGMVKGDIASQRSMPLQATMKSSDINSAEMKSGEGSSSSTTLRSVNKLSKGTRTPRRGVVQDFSEAAKLKESSPITNQHSPENLNDLKASTSSKIQRRKGQLDPEQLESKEFRGSESSDKDKKQIDKSSLWWSTLPYVFVILMTKGHGNDARQGLYTIQMDTDADCTSSYIVAFEDQNDAKNFSYILDSVFEELLDSSVDVIFMLTKELTEITESLNKRVMVARKGELKPYAGQPLVDVESALISLVR